MCKQFSSSSGQSTFLFSEKGPIFHTRFQKAVVLVNQDSVEEALRCPTVSTVQISNFWRHAKSPSSFCSDRIEDSRQLQLEATEKLGAATRHWAKKRKIEGWWAWQGRRLSWLLAPPVSVPFYRLPRLAACPCRRLNGRHVGLQLCSPTMIGLRCGPLRVGGGREARHAWRRHEWP